MTVPTNLATISEALEQLEEYVTSGDDAASFRQIFRIDVEIGRFSREQTERKEDLVELQLSVNAITSALKRGDRRRASDALTSAIAALTRLESRWSQKIL